ncbi:hypothetical protein MMC32_006726 [Xylographa parallela]|nr:hypothetical protein [Xylographa parallela]
MRFKSSIRNISTFIKLTASLNSLGKVAWIRLDNDQIRCTVIPEQGSQVWAVLSIVRARLLRPQQSARPKPAPNNTHFETIFDDYSIQSAAPNNTINLEVPLASLHRALRSAQAAASASIRLTKKDAKPLLSLTILTTTHIASSARGAALESRSLAPAPGDPDDDNNNGEDAADEYAYHFGTGGGGPQRETTITQDIPVRVLSAAQVDGIHEPRCRDPDVHILLPSLLQLKSISERFTKLALSATQKAGGGGGFQSGAGPRLEIAANMHGGLRVGIRTEGLRIESTWAGLSNPELDAANVEGGEEGVRRHPSTRMKAREGEEAWAVVRVEGRDWGRVLGVGRLGGRVIACEW